MNLKKKHLEENNFIFSPRGTIERIRYIIYAIILQVLYKLFFGAITIFNKQYILASWIFIVFALITIILKFFNYKKKIC